MRSSFLLAFTLAALEIASAQSALQRRLYVTNAADLSVYDIDRGHTFLRTIAIPNSGDYKGIGASAPLGLLFVTSHRADELIAIDLAGDTVVWRKNVGKYADSFWVTPDGLRLWLPLRGEIAWKVIDARTGEVLGHVDTERGKRYDIDPIADIGPHNTWMNADGSRVYMEVLTVPYVYVADARTMQGLGRIGPFSKGVRPFAVSDDERHLYANVDGLLGFEIAEVDRDFRGGRVVRRVEARTPVERFAEITQPPPRKPHSTPSHGLNLHPNQSEVWIVDGVYGYVYAFDVASPTPRQIASIPIFANPKERPHPGWLTFGIDGSFAYPDGGVVIDTKTKRVVARIPTSEKLIEIDFVGGKPVRAGHR